MSHARRPLVAGIAVLGAAAVIAGCGGGSSDSSSADDFRQQADEICADANDRLAAVPAPQTNAQILDSLQAGLPIQADELARLKALDPPEDLQADFDQAVDLLQQRQDAIQAAADKIANGDDAATVIQQSDAQIDDLRAQAQGKAKDLGLTVCGAGTNATAGTTGTAPAPTTTAPAETTGTAGLSGQNAAYVEDARAAATKLQEFGAILQSTTSLADLKTKVPEAEAKLDEFDAAIAKLDTYTLDNPTLEKQRAGLAATGPKVSEVLNKFIQAASTGDTEAVQAVVPELSAAIQEFQNAATP
jgi:hypothetical protein